MLQNHSRQSIQVAKGEVSFRSLHLDSSDFGAKSRCLEGRILIPGVIVDVTGNVSVLHDSMVNDTRV